MPENKKRRVSRDDWLKAGLELLSESGVEAVKIDRLSKRVGVAKTGFYWHFKNRQALLDAMLEFWEREYTTVVSSNLEVAALPAAERLEAINRMVDQHWLTEFDLAITHWAQDDEAAASAMERTYKHRQKFVRAAFRELGFTGDELEMRTRLFACYVSNAAQMFGHPPTARDRRLRTLRNQLLIQPFSNRGDE